MDHEIEGRAAISCLAALKRVVVSAFDAQSRRMRNTGFDVADPARPKRIFDSGDAGVRMTHSPDISTIGDPKGNQLVTAMRMEDSGRLRVQRWDIDSNTNLVRDADCGPEAGPVIDASPSISRSRAGRSTRFHTVATRNERLLAVHWR